MIAIIDYQTGNLGSIKNMLKRVGETSIITSDSDQIAIADKLILPGVGAFNIGMKNLNESGFIDALKRKVLVEKTPILGICLGMQLMTRSSEEGISPGLGWIDGDTVRFNFNNQDKFKIPNMGWNSIEVRRNHPLLEGIDGNSRFYFVHSYHVVCNENRDIIATSNYGYDFPSIFIKDNVMGTQFHPEKSLKYGMMILRNFASYKG